MFNEQWHSSILLDIHPLRRLARWNKAILSIVCMIHNSWNIRVFISTYLSQSSCPHTDRALRVFRIPLVTTENIQNAINLALFSQNNFQPFKPLDSSGTSAPQQDRTRKAKHPTVKMMYPSTTVAVLGLAALSSAHMIMNTPVPYGKSTLNNSPLLPDGSDFPCKQRTGVYAAEGASNSMALGSSQNLAFTGSATHGGGSCQVSITYDQNPTKSSTFKVIHSIEGGCPIRNVAGNNGDDANAVDPDTYSFTVPSSLPTGSATLAWTWFNKIGNREMYMNCAPITITGGSSSRRDAERIQERDQAAYNALPDMFTANIGNGCGTVDSTDLLFPDPGDSVEQDGLQTSSALSTPTGSSCGQVVAPSVSPTAGGGSGSASQAASSVASTFAPQVTSAATSAATTSAVTPGGVFATVESQAAPSASPVTTIVASPSADATVASTAAAATTPASDPSSTPSTSSGAGALSGACTSEGLFNCIGGSSFQQCASGAWSVVQSVAAGTSCSGGQSMDLNIAAVAGAKRRAVLFSG